MPQNSYSNKDLNRFRRTPARPDEMEVLAEIPRESAVSAQEPSVESLLAAARGTLDRANKLSAETGSADIAQIPRRLANVQNSAGYEDIEPIDMLDYAATVPLAASVLPTPAAPVTAAIAGLMKAPKALRSLVEGNYGQGVMEAGEAALVGAPGPIGRAIGAGFRGAKGAVRGLVNSARQGSLPGRVLGGTASTEIPYASQQIASNPNQVLEVARDIAAETGDDLGVVLRGGSKAGLNRESAAALERLAGSGAQGRSSQAIRQAQEAAQTYAPPSRDALLQRAGLPDVPGIDPSDFLGDRTTGSFVEGSGGLSDIAAGRFTRYPLPESSRYMSEVDDLARQAGFGDDLADFGLADDAVSSVGQVTPNARDVDMLVSGVLPQEQAARASKYASDPMKRKTPSPKSRGKSKASLKALQNALVPMADDVVNAAYLSRGKE